MSTSVSIAPTNVVQAPPAMCSWQPGVMLPGVSYDLFFIGERYYYFHNGYWYGAGGYGGPSCMWRIPLCLPGCVGIRWKNS
jgi:hypothetical protein